MKKFTLLCFLFFVATSTFGSVSISRPPLNASEILLPVGKTGKVISLMELSRIPLKDFQGLIGKKMPILDRLMFKAGQRKLRNSINPDGTLKKKRLEKFFQKRGGGNGGSGLGGFALGYFLFLIGVLIAYLINDDKKRNRVKWAFIGAGVILALSLLTIVVWSQVWDG